MLPWTSFTSFHLQVAGAGRHLLPIFTMGRAEEKDGVRTLPLAIQVHHAVCDGYHVGRFLTLLRESFKRSAARDVRHTGGCIPAPFCVPAAPRHTRPAG